MMTATGVERLANRCGDSGRGGLPRVARGRRVGIEADVVDVSVGVEPCEGRRAAAGDTKRPARERKHG